MSGSWCNWCELKFKSINLSGGEKVTEFIQTMSTKTSATGSAGKCLLLFFSFQHSRIAGCFTSDSCASSLWNILSAFLILPPSQSVSGWLRICFRAVNIHGDTKVICHGSRCFCMFVILLHGHGWVVKKESFVYYFLYIYLSWSTDGQRFTLWVTLVKDETVQSVSDPQPVS